MRRLLVVPFVAGALVMIFGACGATPCDPKNWLPSDCEEGETCDAHLRRCVTTIGCRTSADCSDGFVCYDNHTCARNCNWGMFPFEYCIKGYTCDETTYQCVKRRD
jgi:hypothetical protein